MQPFAPKEYLKKAQHFLKEGCTGYLVHPIKKRHLEKRLIEEKGERMSGWEESASWTWDAVFEGESALELVRFTRVKERVKEAEPTGVVFLLHVTHRGHVLERKTPVASTLGFSTEDPLLGLLTSFACFLCEHGHRVLPSC